MLRNRAVKTPRAGWCDANLSGRLSSSTLSAVDEQDPAEEQRALSACHAQRHALVAHLSARHGLARTQGGDAALVAVADAGRGIISSRSQGSTSLAQFDFLINTTRRLLSSPGARQGGTLEVCEVGFNWGTSALSFLCASPRTRVRSFDLSRGYSTSRDTQQKPIIFTARDWLHAQFPGRLTLTLGSSQLDVPELGRRVLRGEAPPCDLVLVDGGHEMRHAYPDMRSFRCAARRGATMLADDCCARSDLCKEGPFLSARRLEHEGFLRPAAVGNWSLADKHMCIGTYL